LESTFENLYIDGLVKAIGVSNFMIPDLEQTMKQGKIKPMVNQCPYHPLNTQRELLTYCQEQNIQFEAYSPIKHIFDNPVILDLTKKYGKTAAQIVLRWDLQNGVVTIPKSVNESRLKENAAIFDFELAAEDIQKLNGLNEV
jgi:diketogulonate reductase-like aldo/keto reductase